MSYLEPFSLDFLYDNTNYSQLVSSIKIMLLTILSLINQWAALSLNFLISNLNYKITNKIFKLVTKSNLSSYYFNAKITKLKIELNVNDIDKIPIFSFLFLLSSIILLLKKKYKKNKLEGKNDKRMTMTKNSSRLSIGDKLNSQSTQQYSKTKTSYGY